MLRFVKPLAIAAVMIATATAGANAQFKAPQAQPLDAFTSLECAIIEATDYDRNDPVYKIEVNLNFDDSSNLKELFVMHTATSGKTYVRSDQYRNGRIWQRPGKTDWFWSGDRDRGHMTGEVWRTPDLKWFYTEERINGNGRVEYHMAAACHPQSSDRS